MAGNALLLFCSFAAIYGCLGKGLFEGVAHIDHLNKDNFEKKVLKSERAWLVAFYDPKNAVSKESVPEIEKLAKILTGIAKVGVVDSSENDKLAHSYDAKDAPTIILFGLDKEKPTLYKDKVKAENLIKKVGAHVKAMIRARVEKGETNPKKDVVKLTEENFQKKVLESDGIWFVKYYDPNCAHSKAFAPEYAKAAAGLKGAVHFGAVNMDVEIYDTMGAPYDIQRVPTVKIFGVERVKPLEYSGARKSTELIDRAFEEMEKLVKKRLSIEKNTKDIFEGGEGSDEDEDEKADKKEEELTDATKIKKKKEDKKETEKMEKKEDKEAKKEKREEKETKKEKEEKKEKKEKKEDKKQDKEEKKDKRDKKEKEDKKDKKDKKDKDKKKEKKEDKDEL